LAFSYLEVVVDDPIRELSHDHRELTSLLLAVHAAIARIEKHESKLEDELHEIRDGIEGFREALLVHFAREQEGLLPFVAKEVPAMTSQSERIMADHERLAEVLTRVVESLGTAESADALDSWSGHLSRFEELYSAHSRIELAFLQEIARSLADAPQALATLRELLD
jgi:hemerythrin-like domain-containing protein